MREALGRLNSRSFSVGAPLSSRDEPLVSLSERHDSSYSTVFPAKYPGLRDLELGLPGASNDSKPPLSWAPIIARRPGTAALGREAVIRMCKKHIDIRYLIGFWMNFVKREYMEALGGLFLD